VGRAQTFSLTIAGRSRSGIATGGAATVSVVGPLEIRSRAAFVEAIERLGVKLGGPPASIRLVQIAFSTLVDNALVHAGPAATPVVSVDAADSVLRISCRDEGSVFSEVDDPRDELRRRIEIPAEDSGAGPGAPAGIGWLARLLGSQCVGAELVFRAGHGQISWRDGVWVCRENEPMAGFLAVAKIPFAGPIE
jgi:anti-sigma regulatory factor (Ser/Thr protein kinase)